MSTITKRLAAIAATVVLSAAGLISAAAPVAAAKGGGGVTTSTAYSVNWQNSPDNCVTPSTASQSFKTIQAAITCAEENGGAFIINVAPGTYHENLRLGAAGPDSLIINGTAGAANTFISAAESDRTIASYLPDASDCSYAYCTQLTPTIRGFTITGGTGKIVYSNFQDKYFAVGAGVYNGPGSNLTLANDIVTGNDASAVSDGNGGTLFGMGGGIFNDGFAKLTLSSTIVEDNTATAGGGIAVAPIYYACPAELCFSGNVNVQSSSQIINNVALGFGGGLMASYPGNVTVSSSTFSGNQAPGTDPYSYEFLAWDGMGGAIASVPAYAGPLLPGGQVTISGSNLTGNSAKYGGGAVANVGGQLSWTGGTTANNTVEQGPGGGLLNWLEGSAALKTTNINANQAWIGGGIANCYQSTLTLSGGRLQSNIAYLAAPSGGGLNADSTSPWTAKNTIIRGNTPDQTASIDCQLSNPYL